MSTEAPSQPASAQPPLAQAQGVCPLPGLTVYFDGACPLCRREVGVYQGLAARQPVAFVDVSQPEAAVPAGVERAQLLARFHVQRADGRLADGAAGFVALWAALPGWRWLAWCARLPGVTALMELAYRVFLKGRPALQRVAAAFDAPPAPVPAALRAELRSDHAGETGAVWIYLGVLATARNADVRAFARRHLATERSHLRLVARWVPWPQRSRLLLLWRLAGFFTGALPGLFGPRAVYATIAAVETFVDHHYQQQIDQLDAMPPDARPALAELRGLLADCQADERHHRDEAQALQPQRLTMPLRAWCSAVAVGSKAAVALARRV